MKWLAAHQPNYLPYPGFFSKALRAKGFVIANQLQFEKNQKRNLIETHDGIRMLSIPVVKPFKQPINSVRIANHKVIEKHWLMIEHSYRRCKFYEEISLDLKKIYLQHSQNNLSNMQDLCIDIILCIFKLLTYNGKIYYGSDISKNIEGKKNEMIVNLCKYLNYDGYISGLGAKKYINEQYFKDHGIKHMFNEYKPIRYFTTKGNSKDNLSIIDAMFNIGPTRTKELLLDEFSTSQQN